MIRFAACGNQTPLNQEAFLLEIVAALRELHARYILLRSSNTLDQLFLTNFLRRSYPDGRIVIFSPDLMFIRERGATGLSGVMTLGTYPLFPWNATGRSINHSLPPTGYLVQILPKALMLPSGFCSMMGASMTGNSMTRNRLPIDVRCSKKLALKTKRRFLYRPLPVP